MRFLSYWLGAFLIVGFAGVAHAQVIETPAAPANYGTAQYAPPMQLAPPPVELDSGLKHDITFNPFALIFGTVSLEYEQAINPRISFYAGPSILAWNALGSYAGESTKAYGLAAGLRFFISGSAPEGFWVGPDVSLAYANATVTAGSTTVSATGYGVKVSALAGYTWFFSRFVLSLGGGFGFHHQQEHGSSSDGVESISLKHDNLELALRASIGFAF